MNIAIIISYDGTNYSGWQSQPNKKTVQDELEKALFKVFNKQIKTYASGRTDALVSAIGQVVSFNCDDLFPPEKLMYLLNDNLPLDIRIVKSYEVDNGFNARFNAKNKTYEYNFYFGKTSNAYFDKTFSFFKGELNINDMQLACKFLVGTFDFSSFCASGSEVEDKTRTIFNAKIECVNKKYNQYKFVVSGNGFLYNMVRILMGTLINVGYGKIKPESIVEIINKKDRKFAGATVKAHGLVLVKVEY